MSLEDRLASLRAGKAPTALARPLLQPLGDVTFTEVSEDEWDDEPISYIAPPPSQSTRTPPSSEPRTTMYTSMATPPPSEGAPRTPPVYAEAPLPSKSVNASALYETALKIATAAMDNERARRFTTAIDGYAEAGSIFIEIGRQESDARVQMTMKKKAFSLLTRAEALATWFDKVQVEASTGLNISEALTQAEEATSKEVTENEEQVRVMTQELQQLKYASDLRASSVEEIAEVTAAPQVQDMKLALVNEMHSLLNLPEVDHLRTFKPLSEDATKDAYAVELAQQVESLKKELAFEKATHVLGNFVRKKRFQAAASVDDEEQNRLQTEVDRLRAELKAHQAMLAEAPSKRPMTTILVPTSPRRPPTAQKPSPQKGGFFAAFGRKKGGSHAPPEFFMGPRGLKKQQQDDSSPRRRSDPSLQSPRELRRQRSTSGDNTSVDSVWL
ncbi:hypothetical protein SPRG_08838 [Saprolegnia parasitica CBS 223.65]|uniref:MIT domain-containing protein n=1 Tax=Saprolegnia parasitica (strain CBS 223.65) TaxID=695850 RepID=A0A067CGE8_SAPPC|nr:hypothetical protein SPRG_08838 [Saprolegnia parasitica CBS 223.65]KDO25897.1 hypothetical protein SPRG_08838 [Saprolegnia parasitica CBS 223.65]|eukprot:XP_012203457.1 hypothetical protein SPRG_08838 [Saprolegnia parasitica CBS 223.65]